MRKVPRPGFCTRTTFSDCISGVRDSLERANYEAIADEVQAAGDAFEAAVVGLTLHALAVARPVAATVSPAALTAVYEKGMRERIAGRPYYDKLRASAPLEKCPMCSIGTVSTLDHYAPKSIHTMLAVVPINLLPACSICNTGKHAGLPTSPSTHTLHPYFDDFHAIDAYQWLSAEIIHTIPLSFSFSVVPPAPPAWTPILAERVRHHFKSFELPSRFAVEAAATLAGIQPYLGRLFKRAGVGGVQEHLSDQAESGLEAKRNYLETAMYVAMAADPWFANNVGIILALMSPSHAPLPALTRVATTLRTPSGEVALPKSAALQLIGLTPATLGQSSQACVRQGDQVGLLPRADLLLLPAQAVALVHNQEAAGSAVIVLEREAETVRVNSQSWFDAMPTIGRIAPDRLLYTPAEPALLLGDLPLDRWRPLWGDTSAGSGALEQPANVRGLTLPAGATLRWEEGGLWAEATLDAAAQVGGKALQAGDKLAFTQGCDVVLRRAGGGEECFGLTDGALGPPR